MTTTGEEQTASLLDNFKGLTVDDLVAAPSGEHTGQSGFKLLIDGAEAFLARAVLASRARYTLDLQYYIFKGDTSGNLLYSIILHAAERGVRVRLLIDAYNLIGRGYQSAVLNMHPNVEIRLFNPVAGQGIGLLARMLGMVTSLKRLNRRMHNKVFVADGKLVVLGGRNVGDQYFGASVDVQFGDVDVLCAGSIVEDICASFEGYWNSDSTRTLSSVGIRNRSVAEYGRLRQKLLALGRRHRRSGYGRRLANTGLAHALTNHGFELCWSSAQLIVDPPDKVTAHRTSGTSPFEQLTKLANNASRELLLVSPYFIPGERGMSLLAALRARGVRIRLFTNSLASTDVLAVHSGYRRYRRNLLKMGVEVFELKPRLIRQRPRGRLFGSSRASLHAKVYVFDRAQVVTGSLNLDPRSMNLNTEIGVLIESAAFAEEVVDGISGLASPENCYRLELSGSAAKLAWIEISGNERIEHRHEPETGVWRRFAATVLGWLPIEDQL